MSQALRKDAGAHGDRHDHDRDTNKCRLAEKVVQTDEREGDLERTRECDEACANVRVNETDGIHSP